MAHRVADRRRHRHQLLRPADLAGGLPEFSLYLPGHGGTLKLGVSAASGSTWLAQAAEVMARYRPGRMIYEVRDPLLAQGWLRIEVLTMGRGAGLMLLVEARDVPASTALTWAFGGVSGRKGARNGDIGCEVEPVSRFFQVRPEECAENRYTLEMAPAPSGLLHSPACDLRLTFPAGSQLSVADVGTWDAPVVAADHAARCRRVYRSPRLTTCSTRSPAAAWRQPAITPYSPTWKWVTAGGRCPSLST